MGILAPSLKTVTLKSVIVTFRVVMDLSRAYESAALTKISSNIFKSAGDTNACRLIIASRSPSQTLVTADASDPTYVSGRCRTCSRWSSFLYLDATDIWK